jgi:1,4-dihydroxy-2-naphthoate octaprenyltransferase
VNNIRDVDTDRRARKRTLAVRLGRDRARRLFAVVVTLPFAIVIAVAVVDGRPELLLALPAAFLVPPLVRTVSSRTDGPSLNMALARCGALLGLFSVLLSAGLLVS